MMNIRTRLPISRFEHFFIRGRWRLAKARKHGEIKRKSSPCLRVSVVNKGYKKPQRHRDTEEYKESLLRASVSPWLIKIILEKCLYDLGANKVSKESLKSLHVENR